MQTTSNNGQPITISKLAEQTGVSIHCIRAYADRGLISACDRTPGGYYLYTDSAVERLCFIRKARAAGVSVSQLVRLFAARDAENSMGTKRAMEDLERYIRETRTKLDAFEYCLSQKLLSNTGEAGISEQLEEK